MSGDAMPLIQVQKVDSVTHISLDRSDKRNALSDALVEALIENVASACTDGTRLLTLRGIGKNFSAGFDFSKLPDESEGDLLRRFVRIEQLLQAIAWAPFDTAAYAHGRNFGAGVDLFAACNRRWAAPGTEFCMPGLRFGLVLGTRRFANIVGADWAREVLSKGLTFSAETGREHGFISDIFDPGQITDRVDSAARAPLTADTAKRLFRVVRRDTRDADMAELVASAVQPGIKARIKAFREAAAQAPRPSR